MYITTYASPKVANATTTKSTLLFNTQFLLSLLLRGFEVNCGLNVECIIDIADVDRYEDSTGIDRDGAVAGIDRDEDVVVFDRDGDVVGIDKVSY